MQLSVLALTAMSALSACAGGVGAGGTVDVEAVSSKRILGQVVFSAKFLCGTIPAEPGLPQFPASPPDLSVLLAPGTYLTTINIHNPDTLTVMFSKKAVESERQWQGPGTIGESVRDSLVWDQGLQVDCRDIQRLLRDTIPLQTHFTEGFVVVRSERELDVTAVYAFKNVEIRGF